MEVSHPIMLPIESQGLNVAVYANQVALYKWIYDRWEIVAFGKLSKCKEYVNQGYRVTRRVEGMRIGERIYRAEKVFKNSLGTKGRYVDMHT
jgi:hypothetical protein